VAQATNLAVCSVFHYRTLVGAGRALVLRTQTLVWTKRLNSIGRRGFRGFNLTAERRGIAQLRFDCVLRNLAATRMDYPVARTGIRPIQ
jgi:hypothetical protein